MFGIRDILRKMAFKIFCGSESVPESVQNILTFFVNEVKRVLGKDMDKVIVYGSYARGDYNENSDVDISVIVKNRDDFNYWLGALPFMIMWREKVWLFMDSKQKDIQNKREKNGRR